MSKRRKLNLEFKQGATERVREPGVSCSQLTRELDTGANLLSRWKRETEAQSGHRRD
jgi:transposase